MESNLSGKTILIVEGSLLAGSDFRDAFGRAGARVHLTTNFINAFNLLRRMPLDGVVIDQGLHNEAFELCSELRDLGTPYIHCTAPHRLQRPTSRRRDTEHIVWRLADMISGQSEIPRHSVSSMPQAPEGRASA